MRNQSAIQALSSVFAPFSRRLKICVLALIALSALQTASAAPQEFRAQYQLFRNGKLMGSSEIGLRRTRKGYLFETKSESEGGWASLLGGAEISESSEFSLSGEQFIANSYAYRQSVSVKKKRRDISFDWNKKLARESDGQNNTQYLLEDGTLDRHLVVLALAEDLKTARPLEHSVAYKGEASLWKFENKGTETVQTAAGEMPAIKIQRIRANKGRSTISWHAPKYKFLPVKIQQIEPDGEIIEMRLKNFDLGAK